MFDYHLLQIANNPALGLNETDYITSKYQYELVIESSDHAVLSKASGIVKRIPDPNRTSGALPYLFIDNAEYTFGYNADSKKQAKTDTRHASYIERAKQQPFASNEDVQAALGFLSKSIEEQEAILGIKYEALGQDFCKSTAYIVIKNSDGEALSEKYYASIIPIREDGETITDTISGEVGAAMITARKTVCGLSHCSNCFPSGDRWGKSGADQIGMTEKTNILLEKAFNYLLSTGHNSFRLSNEYVYVFFEDSILNNDGRDINTDVCDIVSGIASHYSNPKTDSKPRDDADGLYNEEDDDSAPTIEVYTPDECEIFAQKVHSILNALKTGTPRGKFHLYLLKCGIGTYRWSVVLHNELGVEEITNNIDRFFGAMNVPKFYPNDRSAYSIFSLLRSSVSPSDEIPKKHVSECINSILLGRKFPSRITYNILSRFTKGSSPTHRQMTFLNVIQSASKKEIIPVMLDHTETNISYNLGRMFAAISVAQKITRENGTKTDIGNSMYSSASTIPALVMPMLIRTFNASYLDKLVRTNRLNAHRLITEAYTEAIGHVGSAALPKRLNCDEQIKFAYGYSVQRTELLNAIFTKNQKNDEE